MTEQELLAVLDMDEDFQWNFLITRQDIQEMCQNQLDAWSESKYKRRVLADLAFRLRDEIIVNEQGRMAWFNALFDVNEYVGGSKKYTTPSMPFDEDRWLCYYGKPIHFIIAALITKEKKDE